MLKKNDPVSQRGGLARPIEMEDRLTELYYDPKSGFQGAQALYRRAKELYPDITLKEVRRFLEGQRTSQINLERRRPEEYNTIWAPETRISYQMDLMIYDRYEYRGFKYILMIIDVHSRYLTAVPLKTREMSTVVPIIDKVFEEIGEPQNINCDREFDNQRFNQLCDRLGITRWYSEPHQKNKNAIVERVNRTIAKRLQRWRTYSDSANWPEVLPDIVLNYNTSYHSTIRARPIDVWEGRDTNNQEDITVVDPKLREGDLVRHVLVRSVMAKGDKPQWSKTIYEIEEKKGKKYRLQGKDRWYNDYELQRVREPEPEPELPTEPQSETATAQRERVDQYRRQRRDFRPGHEIAEVTPQGEVVYKPRAAPQHERRQIRRPARYED